MRYIVWLISGLNVYLGLYFLLNAIQVWQSSKYSQTANVVFTLLFLLLGISGYYLSFAKAHHKLALLVSAGPWVIGLLFLFFNLLTGDYK